jgi:Protein of unknown function (DUF4231)
VDTPHGSGPATKAQSAPSSAGVAGSDADHRADSSAVPDRRDLIWDRLEDQIEWFGGKAVQNERSYKLLKYAEILAAAAIPVVTGLDVTREVLAILGGLVLVIESILHLNQYQQNWTQYRSAAEALKHEKFLYLGHAGPYARASEPRAVLSKRVEALIGQEHARWVTAREESDAHVDAAAT